MMTTPHVNTTASVVENPYILKRDPVEAAKEFDKLDLKIKRLGSNKYVVAGETFRTEEEAGEYVRRLRQIASASAIANESPNQKKSNIEKP